MSDNAKFILTVATCACLAACASNQAPATKTQAQTLPTQADSLAKSKTAQDAAVELAKKFYECVDGYAMKHLADPSSASDIAEAAVVSCNNFAWQHGSQITLSAMHLNSAYSRQMSWAELDRRTTQAQADGDNAAEKLKFSAKGLATKTIVELRAMAAEKAKKLQEEQSKQKAPRKKPEVSA